MMLRKMIEPAQLFTLFRQTIHMWRFDRTKKFRFGCSLVRNLSKVRAWVKKLV